jgi:hypothetical protein
MTQRFRKSIFLLSGALLLATQPGASCMSDTSSGGGTNSPQDDRYPPNSGRDEDTNYIPQRADIVREGRGTLRYTTDADGTIYVQNLRQEQTVLTRRVHRGQVIEVLPEENRIRLDDDTVSKSDLKADDTHRLYLLRDRRFEDDKDRSERTDRDGRPRDDTVRPPRGVPADSQLMGDGRNKEISFSPSKSGSVYVYSVEDRKLISRIAIRGGQKFVLSPGKARATVNGKIVEQKVFNAKTTYRVYFNREG